MSIYFTCMVDNPKGKGVSRRDFFKLSGAVAMSSGVPVNKTQVSVLSNVNLPPFVRFALNVAKDDFQVFRYRGGVSFDGLAKLSKIDISHLRRFLVSGILNSSSGASNTESEVLQIKQALNLLADAGKQYPNMSLRDFFAWSGDTSDGADEYVEQARTIQKALEKIGADLKINLDERIADFVSKVADLWNSKLLDIAESDGLNHTDAVRVLMCNINGGTVFDNNTRNRLLNTLRRRKSEKILSNAIDMLLSSDGMLSYSIYSGQKDLFVFEPVMRSGNMLPFLVSLHSLNIAFWAVQNKVWSELKAWQSIKIQRVISAGSEPDLRYVVTTQDPSLRKGLYRKFENEGRLDLPLVPFQTKKARQGRFNLWDLPEYLRNASLFIREDLDLLLDYGMASINL